ASALLLGRERQRADAGALLVSDPIVASDGPNRLRLRAAGSKWLEPLSALRGRVGAGCDRPLVSGVRNVQRTRSAQPGPAPGRSHVARAVESRAGSPALEGERGRVVV